MRYWLWIPVLLAVSAPASASPYYGTQTFDIKLFIDTPYETLGQITGEFGHDMSDLGDGWEYWNWYVTSLDFTIHDSEVARILAYTAPGNWGGGPVFSQRASNRWRMIDGDLVDGLLRREFDCELNCAVVTMGGGWIGGLSLYAAHDPLFSGGNFEDILIAGRYEILHPQAPTPVPEPPTLVLCGIGLCAWTARQRWTLRQVPH